MPHSLEQQLTDQLGSVSRRGWKFQRRTLLAAGWAAVALLVWLGVTAAKSLGPTFAIYGGLAAAACTVAALTIGRRGWSKLDTARRVEAKFPELNATLLTALEQSPDVATGRLNVLQHMVVIEALTHSVSHAWTDVVSSRRMRAATVAAAVSAGLLVGALSTAWKSGERPKSLAVLAPGLIPLSEDEMPVKIDPGDVELERGTSLLVLARFNGPLPNHVQLIAQADGPPDTPLACEKSLDDPVFGARLANVTRDMTYRVEYDGQSTRDYRVTVYDLPALVRSDLVIDPPSYTNRPQQTLENAFTATVVEGSQITIVCQVNKPLKSATLVNRRSPGMALPGSLSAPKTDPGTAVPGLPLTRDANDPNRWTATVSPKESLSFALELVDDRDRRNRDPEDFRIDVLPNHPPKIELAFPGKDVRVSPLEEFAIEGRVVDDIGLEDFGVVLEVAGREPISVSLGQKLGPQPQALRWQQALEELNVEPDDLLSYHLFAVDFGPDGKPRRTTSDLYFAEVRPFEETFRQQDPTAGGQQSQSGGQQQQGNQFNKLIDTQKQIVSAIFNLTRKDEEWSKQREENVDVIRQSQDQLREKLLAMIPDLQTLAQQRLAGAAAERMGTTTERLDEATEQDSSTPLSSALAAAQGAYQSLLKLRARDHRVQQGQQQGGGSQGGSASPSQQQLNELELTNKKNRYESRQTASSEAQTAQQEDLGILDRLRELARRQADLAEKLKELEMARRTAATEEQKEEIERQLKRLRDEQQQLLQDSDELRNRIAQSNRQDQLSNTRQQLEQTRQRQLDATEKLREGQLSQALSSATRAERELQDLHNEFRQQTSARFADAMRELREEARQLSQRENELREQLKESTVEDARPTLRKSRDRTNLENEFRQQRQALSDVVEQSKEIVRDSETAEPLLAQQLYEALRGVRESKLEAAMEAVPSLIKQGFIPAAERAEEQVKEGLDRLQKGIEQAAEAVLGDEVESLKRAKSELAELSQQLQREFERQQGLASDPTGRGQNENQPGQLQNGQSSDQGQKPGQGQQPGESQRGQPGQQGQPPGQRQQGEGQQPGQGQPGQQGQGQQPGQGQTGQPGQPGQGGQSQGGQTPSDTPGQNGQPQSGRPGSLRAGGPRTGNQRGGNEWGGFNQTGGGGNAGPLTGEGYREWSERLRDVETMVSDAELQAEVARLRDQARSLRADFKRHSKTPEWELVKGSLYEPMLELQQKLAEEVARRESPDALVPIDRDPIPARYRELVRSYYERLAKEGEKRE